MGDAQRDVGNSINIPCIFNVGAYNCDTPVTGDLHVASLMSNGQSKVKAIVLIDRTPIVSLTHSPDVAQTQVGGVILILQVHPDKTKHNISNTCTSKHS